MRRRLLFGMSLTIGSVLASAIGCSSKNLDKPLSETEDRLFTLGKAYNQASSQLNRGPKDVAEINSFLPSDKARDILISPNDGQEFVILWGVDFNKLPPSGNDPYYIGAYEKNGKNGKRYVLRFPIGVVLMTEGELKAARFPPGHNPPS